MTQTYHFPEESATHEGTWLQWPHHHQHGVTYRNRVENLDRYDESITDK